MHDGHQQSRAVYSALGLILDAQRMIEDMDLRGASRAPQQLGDLSVVDLLDGCRIVKVSHASPVLLEGKSLAIQGWGL